MATPLPDAEHAYLELLTQLRDAQLEDIRLVGIHSGGFWIAQRLQHDLGLAGAAGGLDISFYRDDFDEIGLHAEVKATELPFRVDAAHVLLVDDVLYTGRTIRGALNVLFDYGRPARVDLAVLVDRGARQLPIAPRWTGRVVELRDNESLTLGHMRDADPGSGFVFKLETETPLSPENH